MNRSTCSPQHDQWVLGLPVLERVLGRIERVAGADGRAPRRERAAIGFGRTFDGRIAQHAHNSVTRAISRRATPSSGGILPHPPTTPANIDAIGCPSSHPGRSLGFRSSRTQCEADRGRSQGGQPLCHPRASTTLARRTPRWLATTHDMQRERRSGRLPIGRQGMSTIFPAPCCSSSAKASTTCSSG